MVRRDRVIAIPRDAPPEEVQRILLEEGHSRMPVYDGDLDHLVGYVVARDVLALAWEQNLIALDDIIRPLVYVPLSARIGAVLREMQARRMQIAIVVDEHGGTAGLVTIEDLVEELVGDIFGENDLPERDVRRRARRQRARSRLAADPQGQPQAPHRAADRAREHDDRGPVHGARARGAGGRRKLDAPDGTLLEVVDASPRRVRMVRVFRRATRGAGSARDGARLSGHRQRVRPKAAATSSR